MARQFSVTVRDKLFTLGESKMGQHLVTAVLKDGRQIKNVQIYGCAELCFRENLDFEESDVVDVIYQPWTLPEKENRWWEPENVDWWKK